MDANRRPHPFKYPPVTARIPADQLIGHATYGDEFRYVNILRLLRTGANVA
jgi:hypothetical protein